MSRRTNNYHGILLVDKPGGMTSHDVVDRVRRIIGQRSVGHTGTLDPAAEGLLVVLLGQATKVARFLSDQDKQYEAEIKLGLVSPTYDAEGISLKTEATPVPVLDEKALEAVFDNFRGSIRQKVPPFSAVHVDGERLYKKARKGEAVQLPERLVQIHRFDLLSFTVDCLRIRVRCSKGTYVRSLAHDIGQRLGCGGYLSSLRRTEVGRFLLSDALTLEQAAALQDSDKLQSSLIPVDEALDLSSITVSDQFSLLVPNGRRPQASDITDVRGAFRSGDSILLKNRHGSLLAIGTATIGSDYFDQATTVEILKYDRVFA